MRLFFISILLFLTRNSVFYLQILYKNRIFFFHPSRIQIICKKHRASTTVHYILVQFNNYSTTKMCCLNSASNKWFKFPHPFLSLGPHLSPSSIVERFLCLLLYPRVTQCIHCGVKPSCQGSILVGKFLFRNKCKIPTRRLFRSHPELQGGMV